VVIAEDTAALPVTSGASWVQLRLSNIRVMAFCGISTKWEVDNEPMFRPVPGPTYKLG